MRSIHLRICGCCCCFSEAALGETRSGNPGAGRLLSSPRPLGGPAQLVTQPSLKSPGRGLRATLARKSWLSVSFPGAYEYKRARLPGPRAGSCGPVWLRRVETELPARRLSECGAEVAPSPPLLLSVENPKTLIVRLRATRNWDVTSCNLESLYRGVYPPPGWG